MIAWKYLNKFTAAITAIQDYPSMRHIIAITPQEIKDRYEKLCTPSVAILSGAPSSHNPQSGEARIVHALDEMDVLHQRYEQAMEYMAWFNPAWNTLTDTQRTILSEFYMSENLRSGANVRLQNALGYCERQIGRLRSKALNRLVTLLFGG